MMDRRIDAQACHRRPLAWLALLLALLGSAVHAQDGLELSPVVGADYRLGAADELQIDVFNEPDLSGKYTLDGTGKFSMHLIGVVDAAGQTASELEQALMSRLRPDFLVNPRVSVRVLKYRPFYIIGEVGSPQAYPYVDGMTYLNAIAIAGGYTYRAKKDVVFVIRAGGEDEEELRLEVSERVQPGDIIRVAERLF